MRKNLAAALLLTTALTAPAWADMYPDASNAANPQAINNLTGNPQAHTYYASAYGDCAADVGACIQAAATATAAAGGGTVVAPAGKLLLSTGVVVPSKVYVTGAGAGAHETCGTEIEAAPGFTGVMFKFSDVASAGLGHMCVDPAGYASKALMIESTITSRFNDLILTDATDATLHVDVSSLDEYPTSQNEFRNIIVRAGGTTGLERLRGDLRKIFPRDLTPENTIIAPNADACRLGDYVASPPHGTNDVNSNTFDNFTCIARDRYALDLRGADSNRFINVRFDNSGTGYSIFRAGLAPLGATGPGSLLGWARYNTFIGASFGGATDGWLLIEGSDCNVDGALVKRVPNPDYVDPITTPGVPKTLPVPIPATCPGNTGRRPSRDNMIDAYAKGGGQPNPILAADADVFCNAVNIGGNCGNSSSPWLNTKLTPPVVPEVANYTIKSRDCGTSFNNRSAGVGTDVVFTLPSTSIEDGGVNCRVEISRYSGGAVTVLPSGTDRIYGPGGATAVGEAIRTNFGQSSIVLEDQSNNAWLVKSSTGPWLNTNLLGTSPTAGWVGLGSATATGTPAALGFLTIPEGLRAWRFTCDRLVPVNDAVNARVTLYNAGGLIASNYAYVVSGDNTTASDTTARITTATQGFLLNSTTALNSNVAAPLQFEMILYDPSNTTGRKSATWFSTYEDNAPLLTTARGGGAWTGGTDALTGVRFGFQTGNMQPGAHCGLSGLVP